MKLLRRITALLLSLSLLTVSTVSADGDLEAAVASAFLPRTHDAALHDIAHRRAVEISTNFSHDGFPGGDRGEVIALNKGFPNPPQHAVEQWVESPPHNAVLSNPYYDLIGCGSYVSDDGTYYAVCLVGHSDTAPPPVRKTAPAPPIQLLADTAVAHR